MCPNCGKSYIGRGVHLIGQTVCPDCYLSIVSSNTTQKEDDVDEEIRRNEDKEFEEAMLNYRG